MNGKEVIFTQPRIYKIRNLLNHGFFVIYKNYNYNKMSEHGWLGKDILTVESNKDYFVTMIGFCFGNLRNFYIFMYKGNQYFVRSDWLKATPL